MFFSATNKNLNWVILTKNLVTFKLLKDEMIIIKTALWYMHLSRWHTFTNCWYQWINDDHFIYQGFPNEAKRWEVGIPSLGQANHVFC